MRRLIRDPSFIKWFYFGMHIKRWLLLLLIGVSIMGLGFGYFLREVYVSYTFPAFMYYVTLQFLPRLFRGILFVSAALAIIGFSVWKLNSSLLSAFIKPERNESIVDIIYNHRYLRRGPKIVAIGGGTGLSTLLRGLKEYTGNITAIVSIADDGGSSGRLQRELGVLPPGDIRKNIAALADAEPLMSRLFEYRFEEGEGLGGHSFGNLFIVAMTEVAGNFEEAVRETSRVLAVRGQILPATLSALTICAKTEDGTVVRGESSITEHGHVKEVFLDPPTIQANPDAIRAILNADLIVCGPGSLMTSVLPNLLVEGIRRAIEVSPALKVYVCNVATQHGETDEFRVSDHYRIVKDHLKVSPFDFVLANSNTDAVLPEAWHSEPVKIDDMTLNGARVVKSDVVDEEHRYRHDSKKLADALVRLYYERNAAPEPEPAPVAESAAQEAGVG
ncbi:MAG TPA: gluconeogenesis factor YvcK family protein [Dehalococcoidia bacterium]|nr:gluconeogenesis factor YvcK family protein [Dehalococcoidia bacterium]